jgi:hypothetical protein
MGEQELSLGAEITQLVNDHNKQKRASTVRSFFVGNDPVDICFGIVFMW